MDNIKLDLGEIKWRGIDWIILTQHKENYRAFINAVMSLHVPQNSWNFSSGCTTGGLSSNAQLHTVS
jgi:hypothetical protein